VFISTGMFTDQFLYPLACLQTSFYIHWHVYRPVFISTGMFTDQFLYPLTCLQTSFYIHWHVTKSLHLLSLLKSDVIDINTHIHTILHFRFTVNSAYCTNGY